MALYVGNKKYCAVQKIGVNNQDLLITANGNYTPDEGYSGFSLVRVQVPEPIFEELTVNPSTQAQTLLPLNDGFSQVIVNPVTASIDMDITAANIKKGINILGVDGSLEFVTEEITINPSTSQQTKLPTVDGFSKVIVPAVTSNIDENITAGNIKKDVKILGVTGTLIESKTQTRNITENGTFTPEAGFTGFSEVVVDVEVVQDALEVTPSTVEQTFTAADAYHGYSPVTVKAVTSAIDEDIKPENILKGKNILGVEGTIDFEEITLDADVNEIIVRPTTNGFSKVTLNPITAAIDPDITPENIKLGVDILGVTGTLDFQTEELTITPTTAQQTHTPTKDGYSKVTINAVTAAIDNDIAPGNIKSGVNILGVEGTCVESKTQTKTITSNGTFTPDSGYNGFSSVTVDVDTVNNQTKTITANGTYTPDAGYTGFSSVTVDINTVNNTTLTADNNGTYTVPEPYTGFSTVTVNVNSRLSEKAVTPTTSAQTITPASGQLGFNKITVAAVTSAIDSDIKAANIKSGVNILGVTGTCTELKGQTKTVSPTATTTTVTPDTNYNGLTSVTVNLNWIEQELIALNAGDSV